MRRILPRALVVLEALPQYYSSDLGSDDRHKTAQVPLFISPSGEEEHRGRWGEGEGEKGRGMEGEGEDIDYHHLKHLEGELRRKNPDLLDKIRFAMSDKQYGVLLGLLARGAFWAAAIYGSSFLLAPIVLARAIGHSRLKQIERRNLGIKPRYFLRPDDTY